MTFTAGHEDAEPYDEMALVAEVRLAVPLHEGHEVRLGLRRGDGGAELQLVAHARCEVVTLDRLQVDGLAGQFLVAPGQLPHVAERDQRVAHPPDRDVAERVADVPELQVDDRHEVAVGMVELARVPHARPESTAARRQVAVVPAEAELGEWICVLLALAVAPLHVAVAGHARVLARAGVGDAGLEVGRRVGPVQARQLLQVLVHHTVAVDVVNTLEVGPARHPVHEDGVDHARRLQEAVQVRHRESVLLHQPVERVLVREWEGLGVRAITAQHERNDPAVESEVEEPRGPPAQLPFDAHEAPTGVVLDDARRLSEGRDVRSGGHVPLGSRGRPSARSPSRLRITSLLPPEIVYAFA